MDDKTEIATLQMQLAATMAALQTFIKQNETLLPKRNPPPLKSYFGGKAEGTEQPEMILEANEKPVLLPYSSEGHDHSVGLDSDPEDDEYKAAEALLCSATKDNFAEIASSIVNPNGKKQMEEDDTDSVLSEREREEQGNLFDRIKTMKSDKKVTWYKFEAVLAFRQSTWHSDINAHLEESVQEYLDNYMEGGIVLKSMLSKTGEFGDTL